MKKKLSIEALIDEARQFCVLNSGVYKKELFGVTDGKALGTFVEHLFQQYLSERYEIIVGNSANGLDLPSVNTDIKVTSISKPHQAVRTRIANRKSMD